MPCFIPPAFEAGDATRWGNRQDLMSAWYRNLIADPSAAIQCFLDDYGPIARVLSEFHGRVLDVGGGLGVPRHYLSAGVDYVVLEPLESWRQLDPSPLVKTFPSLASRPNLLQGVGEYIPFPDGSFDGVLVLWALNHAVDPRRVVAEAVRVLRPGGRILLVIEEPGTHPEDCQADHIVVTDEALQPLLRPDFVVKTLADSPYRTVLGLRPGREQATDRALTGSKVGRSRAISPTPRVSVIVTCFNLGQYLCEAVNSLLAQTFDDFEIVIVDDGSTDDETRGVLDRWNCPGTRLIRSPENRGLPTAKNLGLRHTTGEYVCMFDADDRAHPELLSRSVKALDADPSLAFVSHWLQAFGDDTSVWSRSDCGFPALLHHNRVNGAALVRRSAIEAVGGFDESFREGGEDWDLWIALVERGFRGRVLPQALYEYRRRVGSMSRLMDLEQMHPDLCRRLAAKHETSYRVHIHSLRRRRERALAALQSAVHHMDIEVHDRLVPELQSLRDNAVERGALRRDEQAAKDEVAGAQAIESGTGTEPSGSAHEVASPASPVGLEAARLAREVHELRTSISWRVTAPGRRLYDLWLRLRG
ncbi:MAG: glycosyltransferase [Vicinamibacterales bacterium]